MSDSSIPVGSTGKDLQTYLNTIGGAPVHSEAVTPTDTAGVPFSSSNPFPTVLESGGTGLTTFRNAAVTNTAVAVKASAGKLHGYNIFNPGVALAYMHVYNVAAASVTVGTTTPVLSLALPSNSTAAVGLDGVFPLGIAFSTAISVASSTTPTGGTAPGTALVVNALYV